MSVPHEALDQLVVVEGYVATPRDDQWFRSMRLSQDPELPWNDRP